MGCVGAPIAGGRHGGGVAGFFHLAAVCVLLLDDLVAEWGGKGLYEAVEWLDPTVDEDRLIMPQASTWWEWSRDAALRYKPYLCVGVGFLRKLGQLARILQSRENMNPVYWKSIM